MPEPNRSSAALLAGPWPIRVAWAALPLTVGPSVGEALHDRSTAVGTVGGALAWALWAGVLVAVLVPRTTSLTALRAAVPVVAGASAWATTQVEISAAEVVALGWSAVLVLVAFAPSTGQTFVNGSAYGDEQRMPLRPPAPLLAGPVVLAWAALAGPAVAGPLLLAARAWVAGGLVLAAGLPAAWVSARALHGLARRWLVFVPAGLVVHDPLSLADPVLLPRTLIQRIGPAPADTEAVELTRGALGLALELELTEPTTMVRRPVGRAAAETISVTRVLVTPTRPGAVLRLADERRFAVG
jgi:hypothetical protein